MRGRQEVWIAAVLLLAVTLSTPVFAQSATTGIVEGRVTDESGRPLANAVITVSGVQAPAVAVTDAQGRFLVPNLSPGDYNVRADAKGFGSVVLKVQVSINSRARADFKLAPGKVEEVTVSAEAPLVDTKTTTTGGLFTIDKFVEYLPVGRNLAQTLTLAPGVESGLGTGQGNPSISGSSGLENSYLIDGVNITNTGYGGLGAYNIVFGSLGTGVTYDFLEEVQIKTGAIDPEYGQATGGVVNTVVKSGTNAFSGAVSIYGLSPVQDEREVNLSVGATNIKQGNLSDNRQVDFAASIGGPIVKDKFFFFGAYNPVKTYATAAIEQAPLPAAIADGFETYPAALAGPQTRFRSIDNYAGKLSWYASPNHRLELSAFGDPSVGPSGPQRFSLRNLDFADGGGLSDIRYGGNNYSLKYDAVFTPKFFMQFQVGRKEAKFRENSFLDKSRYTDQRQLRCFLSPRLCVGGATGETAATWAYGGVGFISNADDRNTQGRITATFIAGSHEIKAGVQYDHIEYTDAQEYSGEPFPIRFSIDANGSGSYDSFAGLAPCGSEAPGRDCYAVLNTTSGVTASRRNVTNFRVTRGRLFPTPPPTRTKEWNLFVQDTWSISNRWTAKMGVRFTRQRMQGSGEFTLPIRTSDVTHTRVLEDRTYQASTYVFPWEWAPRFGLTYDVKGDGRSKIYANAARYFERIPNDLSIRALSNEVSVGATVFSGWDIDAGVPTSQTSSSSLSGSEPTAIVENTRLPYVDEVVLGLQQEIGRNVSLEVRAIYRSQGRALEDLQYTSVESTENYYFGLNYGYPADPFPGFPAQAFTNYILANPGDNTQAGFPSAVRKYKALEFIVQKRFSDNWLLYGNFRVARLDGNYEGLFRNDNGQSDPNITSLFDFPNSPLMSGQFEPGVLNTDRPYSLKLYAAYQWDNGINLGASFNWASGVPRTPLLAHPNAFYQNAGEVPGSNPIYYWFTETDCTDPSGLCLTEGPANAFFEDAGAYAGGFFAFPHLKSYTKAPRGSLGRTPDMAQLDLTLSWSKRFHRYANFKVAVSVFNVFGTREVESLNDNVEFQAGVPDPDFNRVTSYQAPRSLRASLGWSF